MKATALLQFVAAVFAISCELKLTANASQLFHYTKRDISRQFTIGPGDLMHAGLAVAVDDEDSTIAGYVLGLNGSVVVLVQTAVQFLEWQGVGYPEARVNMSGVNPCSCLERGIQICFLNCTLEDRDNYISLVNMESERVQVEISFTDVNESTPTPTAASTATCNSTPTATAGVKNTRKKGSPQKNKCPAPKKSESLLPPVVTVVYSQTPTPTSVPLPQLTNTGSTSPTEPPLPSDPTLPSPTIYADVYNSMVPSLQNPSNSPVVNENPFADIHVSPTLSLIPSLLSDPNVPQTDLAASDGINSLLTPSTNHAIHAQTGFFLLATLMMGSCQLVAF